MRTLALVTSIAAAALAINLMWASDGSAQVCYDFQGDAIASGYSSPFQRFSGTFPNFNVWTFENAVSTDDFSVLDNWGGTGNRSLWPDSDSIDITVTLLVGGVEPDYVSMDLGVYNSDLAVKAFDDTDTEIWSDTLTHDDDYFVEIQGVGDIAYIRLTGGDHELWIDNVCVDHS